MAKEKKAASAAKEEKKAKPAFEVPAGEAAPKKRGRPAGYKVKKAKTDNEAMVTVQVPARIAFELGLKLGQTKGKSISL